MRATSFVIGILTVWSLSGGAGCKDESAAPASATAGRPGQRGPVIRGAGATFPYAVYARWALLYFEETGLRVEYERSGSLKGVAAVSAGSVDFGATDIPLSAEELKRRGLIQFPMVIGGAVPVHNLPGVGAGRLRLTADILAGIYQGRIKRWDDPTLQAINPGLRLPARQIIPIRRSSESGTTWLFRQFLKRASRSWREDGHFFGVTGESNLQVAGFVKRFKHTLGLVEFTYALDSGLSWASLRNRGGAFSIPGRRSFRAAAERGTWSDDGLRLSAVDAPGKRSWPITGASYIQLRKKQKNATRTRHMLRFFRWALTSGARAARNRHKVPIPRRHVARIERVWTTHLQAGGQRVWPKETYERKGVAPAPVAGAPDAAPRPAAASAPAAAPTSAPAPPPALKSRNTRR